MEHNGNTTAPLETLGVPSQVFLVTIYSLTAVIAFVLNLLTIVVLVKGRRCTRDLRKFLINLSLTDLLMAISTIPFTYTNYMFGRWIFWTVMCPLVNMAQLTTITVSIYTLVAIAIDRYFAIMHPLQRSISWFKTHRALIVLFIWVFGISIGLTQIWVTKTDTFLHNGISYTSCGERWRPESFEGQLYTGFIFTVTFALPMSVLSVVYTAMGCRLLRYRMPGQLQQHHGSGSSLKSPEQSDLFAEGHLGQLNGGPFRRGNGADKVHSNGSAKTRLLTMLKNEAAGNVHNHSESSTFVNEHQESQMKDHKQQTQNKAPVVVASTAPVPQQEDPNNEEGDHENEEEEDESMDEEDQQNSVTFGELAAAQETVPQINEPEGKQYVKPSANGPTLGKPMYRLVAQNGNGAAMATSVQSDLRRQTPGLQPWSNNRLDSHSSSSSYNAHNSSNKIINLRRNKVLKMLIIIIGVFSLCWLPIQLFSILIYFSPNFLQVNSPMKYYCFVYSYFFCHWISCAHSAMNPIIYSFMSKNFKDDIRYIFGRFWHLYILRKDHFRPANTASHLMHNAPAYRHNHAANHFFGNTANSKPASVLTQSDEECSPLAQDSINQTSISARPKVQFHVNQQNVDNLTQQQSSLSSSVLSVEAPTWMLGVQKE